MDEKLYIPMGVKPEAEFFKGFGKKQMMQAAAGSLACGLVACLLWFITQKATIGNMLCFARSQKIYPYCYGDEWTKEQWGIQ